MENIDVVLGIDIGGTNTVFGYVDRTGRCITESSVPTNSQEDAEKLFKRVFEKADALFNSLGTSYILKGIGIGAPNANYYKGTVELPPNLSWDIVNVIEIVHKYHNIPAAITNDANAAAIGEMEFGAARGMKDFIVITLGTGLGSGIVVNGQLVYGHDGFAGELGHTIVDVNGRQCNCGRQGCLETYVSAPGIKRTVFELLCNSTEESSLRSITFESMTSKMIYDAALENDPIALKAFDYTGRILGIKLADAVAYISPEAIILFGGLAGAGRYIFEPTQKYMEHYMLNIFRNKVKLIPSSLTEGNTAVLGAAALIWNEIDNKRIA